MAIKNASLKAAAFGASALVALASSAAADQVIADDLIVQQSLCVGQDCVNGENFGFDTIRMKENNLRIKAQDTSNSSSFPTVDWQLTFNDSSNGGQNKFSIDDIDNGRTPFTIEAAAPSHSLYVDDGGRIGLGTATPVVELHVVDGDSPTLRLQQDGSSGFTAQTWDLAGNEAGFFVRDVTNGSQLPFRIIPGADSESLVIGANNDVGVGGDTTPEASLHVKRTNGTARVYIQEASATPGVRELLKMSNNGGSYITIENTAVSGSWYFTHENSAPNRFLITHSDGGVQFALDRSGNVTLAGDITTTGSVCGSGCDRVFDADYPLPTITQQAQMMFSDRHLPNVGPTDEEGPFNVTQKVAGMLNELEKAHIYIAQLNDRLSEQDREMAALRAKVDSLN